MPSKTARSLPTPGRHSLPLRTLNAALLAAWLLSPAPIVHAQALGKAVIQSALGEPLVAEIEVPEANENQLGEFQIALAPPEAYAAAGLTRNPALQNVRSTLKKRPDGRVYLELRSDRPVTEPFIELLVQAQWPSGRLQREYTLLLDPPRNTAAVTPTPAQTAPTPVAAPPAPVSSTPTAQAPTPEPAPAPAPAATPAPAPATAAAPAPTPSPRSPAERVVKNKEAPAQTRVARGDTAGAIAARYRPAGVSLDQMLVAMMRANPDAFIRGNVNRLKAGAVLRLPTEADSQAVDPQAARQEIAAQSRDFNEFRRRLAGAVPQKALDSDKRREASGQVQTEVKVAAPLAQQPDTLTLSKAQQAEEAARVAAEQQAKETAAREAELKRNIDDLNKLQAAVGTSSGTGAAAPESGTKAPEVPAPVVAVPPPAPAPTPAPVQPAADSTAAGGSWIDQWREQTWVLPGAASALALLGAWGWLRWRRRQESVAAHESSFLDITMQPDSILGAVRGAQRVDTAEMPPFQVSVMESATGGSSLVYSPSQLDAGGDVDPVAEADVYLAYGKDLQAEEILTEALRSQPQRLSVRSKLLEIYAKRKDPEAFQRMALSVRNATGGQGPEWLQAMALGQAVDPGNPLYISLEPQADPAPTPVPTADSADAGAPVSAFDTLDINLDLDDSGAVVATPIVLPTETRETEPMPGEAAPVMAEASIPGIDLTLDGVDLDVSAVAEPAPPAVTQALQEPLRTKLALAREFIAISDIEGARAMAQEVLAQGDESLKAEAQSLLDSLS